MKSILFIISRKDQSIKKKIPKLFQDLKLENLECPKFNIEKVLYEQEVEGGKNQEVMEGYALNKKLIMKAWARYRPNFTKNNDMFAKKKKSSEENYQDLASDFWDESFMNNLLA